MGTTASRETVLCKPCYFYTYLSVCSSSQSAGLWARKQFPFGLCAFPYIMCSSTLNEANSRYQNIMHQKWEKVKRVYTVLRFLLLQVFSKTASSWKGEGKGTGGGVGRMQWVVWQCRWRLEYTTAVSATLLQVWRFWVFAGMFNLKCCQLSQTEYPEPRAGGKHALLKPIQ